MQIDALILAQDILLSLGASHFVSAVVGGLIAAFVILRLADWNQMAERERAEQQIEAELFVKQMEQQHALQMQQLKQDHDRQMKQMEQAHQYAMEQGKAEHSVGAGALQKQRNI